MDNSKKQYQDTIEVFKQCGTCSRTFSHLLDKAFDHPKDTEERASDLLAGGIMNHGHQCGMLWGASLAAGAEAFRSYENEDQAIEAAISATQQIMTSFEKETGAVNCREVINIDLSRTSGFLKFILKNMMQGADNNPCYKLAGKWAPEAIQTAKTSLSEPMSDLTNERISCASVVAEKMGANKEEKLMVAGFAGGLGLSGHACGALSAAIWMKTLAWCKENPGKNPPYFNNKAAKKTLKAFYKETASEIVCSKISGCDFKSPIDHTVFIKNGGCSHLIEILARS